MKKYIILIICFLIALFTIHNVYALDSSYSSSNFQIFYYNSPSGGTATGSGYSSGLDVSHPLNGGYLYGLYIQVFGSNNIIYKAGDTYTFTFKVNFNPKVWNSLDNSFTTSSLEVFGNTSASSTGMLADNITSSSLSISNVSGNTYQMIYTYKVTPSVDLKYVLFKCLYPYSLMDSNLDYVYALTTVRVVDLTVTYQQGMGSAIDQQTQVIQNQTDNIINNNNQNTQDIIDNQQQNTQDIINNQNSNTQQQIESQQVCNKIDKNLKASNGYLTQSDTIATSTTYGVTAYIKMSSNDKLKITKIFTSGANMCFYDINRTKIACYNNIDFSLNSFITIPQNTSYFRTSIYLDTNAPQFELCQNGNQAVSDSINNVNNTLNDDTIPSGNDFFDDFNDMLPSNNTISSLITLPITLYTKILNSINGTCSGINLGSLYGTNLVMPCIDIGSYLGTTLWNAIDLIMSGVFVLVIAKKMVKAFEHFTSLKEGDVINND